MPHVFNIPSDFAYLVNKGLSTLEANYIILIAYEYAKPNHGKFNNEKGHDDFGEWIREHTVPPGHPTI